MKIDHVAIWTHNLENLKNFYVKYFGAEVNDKYVSEKEFNGRFESYFLSFGPGSRLELMELQSILQSDNADGFEATGLTHIAFSIESAEELDRLFIFLKNGGNTIVGKPHITGDGYYEACVLDPDGNRVEITVTPDIHLQNAAQY